ncbi:MAG TPA: hypothetical protein VFV23_14550 [Verrucomicrobiae bacterium]|nr:hypothetical protein [Verrucomicrobiae bacterium]
MKRTLYNLFCNVCRTMAFAGVLAALPSPATDPLYQNNLVLDYVLPDNPPPTIDATAFDNENSFTVSYDLFAPGINFYEPMNTLFYTNNGTMVVNGPTTTNGFIFGEVGGVGYRFDLQTTNILPHIPADTFYNGGNIRCDTFADGNNFFDLFGFGLFIFQSDIGECVVSATNIFNPGTVNVSMNGLMQFSGQTVDLSRGTFAMDTLGVSTYASGATGIDTNAEWNPNLYLMNPSFIPQFVESSLPFVLYLTNSTAYFNFSSPDGTNNVIRVVFLEDDSPTNVAHNVYIMNTGNFGGIGSGTATIEWVGNYQDSATGSSISNFLYLNDNYELGASTNVFFTGNPGYPDNFTFTESNTKLIFQPPATAGFFDVFPDEYISNNYSYVSAQLISSSVATNANSWNPSGALTNLPGRVQIDAAKDLDLNYASIAGPNYLSIKSPNQFEGSAGAQIAAPFADINVGVTNGFLTVSNLMQQKIANWSGTIQAWSTRFLSPFTNVIIVTDTNNVTTTNFITATNDFRVLIVQSQLNPVASTYVQDLTLHGTNSVVISDAFNVLRKLSVDAQNLTLTTNGPGVGAASLDGELNLLSSGIFFSNSLPNLRNLTNNGAISTMNAASFFGLSTTVTSVPSASAVAAIGVLSGISTTNVTANDKVTIGTKTYTFVSKFSRTTTNQVKVASTLDGSLNNLIAAINHGSGGGTAYSNAIANLQVSAGSVSSHSFMVTARVAGASGNTNVTTTTSTRLTWNGHSTLYGGADATTGFTNSSTAAVPYFNFINNGLVADQGSAILADNFESTGVITNGVGNFNLACRDALFTNGALYAGGDVLIKANTLVASNLFLRAGRSLTLQITNLLTDTGVSNGNLWALQWTNNNGGNGLIVPFKPEGDLLGTTISNYVAGPAKNVLNLWPGNDVGLSTAGYVDNLAVGRLILDSTGASSTFTFKGTGVSNAIYVDYLELDDQATNRNGSGDFTVFDIKTNMVIYYARAVMNNQDVSTIMNGRNGNRLRWIPQYAGHFSSAEFIYPDGSTNYFNAALAASHTVDSDGDGIYNASDSTPFFTSSEVNLQTLGTTNLPPLSVIIQWNSIPGATNYLYYSTNMVGPFNNLVTNFVSPSIVPPPGGWPITNIVYDPVVSPGRFYNVIVIPDSSTLYGF